VEEEEGPIDRESHKIYEQKVVNISMRRWKGNKES